MTPYWQQHLTVTVLPGVASQPRDVAPQFKCLVEAVDYLDRLPGFVTGLKHKDKQARQAAYILNRDTSAMTMLDEVCFGGAMLEDLCA